MMNGSNLTNETKLNHACYESGKVAVRGAILICDVDRVNRK